MLNLLPVNKLGHMSLRDEMRAKRAGVCKSGVPLADNGSILQ